MTTTWDDISKWLARRWGLQHLTQESNPILAGPETGNESAEEDDWLDATPGAKAFPWH